jgi:hypothetical protein
MQASIVTFQLHHGREVSAATTVYLASRVASFLPFPKREGDMKYRQQESGVGLGLFVVFDRSSGSRPLGDWVPSWVVAGFDSHEMAVIQGQNLVVVG